MGSITPIAVQPQEETGSNVACRKTTFKQNCVYGITMLYPFLMKLECCSLETVLELIMTLCISTNVNCYAEIIF